MLFALLQYTVAARFQTDDTTHEWLLIQLLNHVHSCRQSNDFSPFHSLEGDFSQANGISQISWLKLDATYPQSKNVLTRCPNPNFLSSINTTNNTQRFSCAANRKQWHVSLYFHPQANFKYLPVLLCWHGRQGYGMIIKTQSWIYNCFVWVRFYWLG